MKILFMLLIPLCLLGCGRNEYYGCRTEPILLIEGEVQRVEYVGAGGLFGHTNTVVYFTDGRTVALGARMDILYTNITVYRTCIMGGSYIIKEREDE